MTDDFDPPIYEKSEAMDFVVAALEAGYEPFHFTSRETLYQGPAVMIDNPDSEAVAEELGVSEVMLESHGAGKYAARMRTSARLKHE